LCELRRTQQRPTTLLRSQRLLNERAARTDNQVSVYVRVVNFNQSEVSRSKRVVHAAGEIVLFPCQSAFAEPGRFLIDFVDHLFERVLEMRRIVDLKHQLPRRSRQDWSINRESKLSTEWCGDIVANVESALRLLLVEIFPQVVRDGVQHTKKIVDECYGVLNHEGCDDVRIGRDVLERTHRSRSGQPRRNTFRSIAERQRSLRVRLSTRVFLIEHEVLHAQNSQPVQRRFALFGILTFCALIPGFRNNLLEVRCDYQSSAFLVNLRDTIAERSCSKAAQTAAVLHCRDSLKLLQLRTCRKQVLLDPNIKFVFAITGRRCSQRVFDELDLRTTLLIVRILRNLLLEELLEA